MDSDYLPRKEADFLLWMENFALQLSALALSLNVSPATVTQIETANTAVHDALNIVAQAKAAAKGATQDKDTSFRNTKSTIRALVKSLQLNPNMTDAFRGQLGITVPSGTRVRTTPKTPLELLALPSPNGDVEISFKRNGNGTGVVFLVYSRTEGGAWQQIAATTKTRDVIFGLVPGQMRWFKVVATANGLSSGFSNEAVIYVNEGDGSSTLQIAA